jgi:SAM-dependent methyltransferase
LRYRGRNLQYRALFDVLRRHTRGDVLDVGGGGFVGDAMAAGVQFDAWTVVEPHEADLPSVSDPRVHAIVGDGCALDHADASFDTVLSIQVLEHVFEPIRMLEELHRVARPGAAIIVMVPQTANVHHAPHHYQNLTRYWLEEAAQRLGAEVVEYHALGGAWSTIASRLLLQYPAAFGIDGYAHPGARRSRRFWALFPLGAVVSIVTFPFAMLLSLGDLEEEANNHLIVLRKQQ